MTTSATRVRIWHPAHTRTDVLRMSAQSIVTTILIVAMPATAIAQQPALARIDSVVRAEMSRQRIPGVAVAVVKAGAVMLSKGYGESNIEHKVPVTPSTMFQSG